MNPLISIVIPIFNEEGNIASLFDSIFKSCENLSFQIVAVDDGSTDKTPQELADIAAKNPQVTALRLKRNFGQTAALAAGIDHSNGSIIVPLDADGQNDPIDIPRLVEKLN